MSLFISLLVKLVVIDFYSRWIKLYTINNEKSKTIIKKPKDMLSRFGILHLIFADDEPFGSAEFKRLAKEWSLPLLPNMKPNNPKSNLPNSNGLAEK